MRWLYLVAIFTLLVGCGGGGGSIDKNSNRYYLHTNITSTIFWVGEEGSSANGYIPNLASAWDSMWMLDYGGIDDPNNRNGYFPAKFTPFENSFYVALPFNDFDKDGKKKKDLSFIPWIDQYPNSNNISVCKNRWVKIIKGDKVAYVQWEDVGPFGEDDKDYVFGRALPKNRINNNAGIDLSPAVRDYLGLKDIDKVSWQFVDDKDVPDGPWKKIVTTTNINWVSWYKPSINTTWQLQLQGDLNLSYNVDLYDIDLFDSSKEDIERLKREGKRVICYFSGGTFEEWREDSSKFPKEVIGNQLKDWEGERWLDIRRVDILLPIMKERLKLAKEKGCDGVDPDNMDVYLNDSGFDISYSDQLRYNKLISNEAHKLELSVGLKNDMEQIEDLLYFFDFELNEECHEFGECDLLEPFIEAKKPVFNVEYNKKYIEDENERKKLCEDAKRRNFRTLILPKELDGSFRYSCDDY